MASDEQIAKIEEDLKGTTAQCDALKASCEKDASELKKLKADCQEATTQAMSAKEELRQATSIAAGEFADLPLNVEQACQHYSSLEGETAQGSFWLQFRDPPRPQLLGNQLKQIAELHHLARPVMEDLCVALWSDAPLPTSFFGLAQQLRGAVPQFEL